MEEQRIMDEIKKLEGKIDNESKDNAVKFAKTEGSFENIYTIIKAIHKRLDESSENFETHMINEEVQNKEQIQIITELTQLIQVHSEDSKIALATMQESLKWMKRIAYGFGTFIVGAIIYIFLIQVVIKHDLQNEIVSDKYYKNNRGIIIEMIEKYKRTGALHEKKDKK